jgi:hypothetical protein
MKARAGRWRARAENRKAPKRITSPCDPVGRARATGTSPTNPNGRAHATGTSPPKLGTSPRDPFGKARPTRTTASYPRGRPRPTPTRDRNPPARARDLATSPSSPATSPNDSRARARATLMSLGPALATTRSCLGRAKDRGTGAPGLPGCRRAYAPMAHEPRASLRERDRSRRGPARRASDRTRWASHAGAGRSPGKRKRKRGPKSRRTDETECQRSRESMRRVVRGVALPFVVEAGGLVRLAISSFGRRYERSNVPPTARFAKRPKSCALCSTVPPVP